MEITSTGEGRPMVLNSKLLASAAIVIFASLGNHTPATAQVMPYRAAPPVCKGKCGSPLCGPCIADTPYAYVPTRWRRWPVMQASATMAPEELPSPTPATAPTEEPAAEDHVPQLPMTPDLPEPSMPPSTAPMSGPSTPLVPPYEEAPAGPTNRANPQVPVFGDEPQVPPSAADPLRSPFNDEPPQPPADSEDGLPGSAPSPAAVSPGGMAPSGPSTMPETAPASGAGASPSSDAPAGGMPFDVGPPKMPSDDPFRDDPIQTPPPGAKSGARLEQAYRETYGLVRNEASPAVETSPAGVAVPEPQLLRADGGSLDAARLPAEQAEPNPLRQVSHPGRRTVALEAVMAPPAVAPAPNKATGGWRPNPLRGR